MVSGACCCTDALKAKSCLHLEVGEDQRWVSALGFLLGTRLSHLQPRLGTNEVGITYPMGWGGREPHNHQKFMGKTGMRLSICPGFLDSL